MTKYISRLYVPALIATNVFALNQHLICKPVSDVFTDTQSPLPNRQTSRSHVQGRPGKRGAIGPKGSPGPRGLKGEAGHVDYNNISVVIDTKVNHEISAITERLNALQKNVTKLSKNMEAFRCSVENEFYNDTCYSTPHLSSARDLNRPAAIQACRKIGFRLAEIYDNTQQEFLENFIRRRMPSSLSEMHLWIGVNFDFPTNSLQYEAGNHLRADQLTWWPSYPTSHSNRVYTMLGVKKSGNDGIWNYVDWKAEGVICEKKMENL